MVLFWGLDTVTLGCSTISILGLYGYSMLGSNTFVWPAMASAQLLILPRKFPGIASTDF